MQEFFQTYFALNKITHSTSKEPSSETTGTMDSGFQADCNILEERDSDYVKESPYILDLPSTRLFHYFNCIDKHLNVVMDIINHAVRIQSRNRVWEKETLLLLLEDWQEIGYTISQCKKLQVILFSYASITEEILAALFQADGNYDFPLKVLDLSNNRFGTEGGSASLPFLKSRKELKYFLLSNNNIDNRGARLLADVLDPMPVAYLDVSCNDMDHEGMERIICHCEKSSLHLSGQLSCTMLPDFHESVIGNGRHVAIGNCEYKMEHTTYTKDFEGLDIASVKTSFHCLKRAKATKVTMKTNIWSSSQDEDEHTTMCRIITEEITSIVSNTSSFDEFCGSNHNIIRFDVFDQCILKYYIPPSPMELALEINGQSDISTNQRLRCKLRLIYFREVFSLLPFVQMKRVWIPHVLELMTISEERLPDKDKEPEFTDEELLEFMMRDLSGDEEVSHQGKDNDNGMDSPRFVMSREGNLNGMYHFIRNWNVPDLFDNQL